MTGDVDAVVVGAGPNGLTAAGADGPRGLPGRGVRAGRDRWWEHAHAGAHGRGSRARPGRGGCAVCGGFARVRAARSRSRVPSSVRRTRTSARQRAGGGRRARDRCHGRRARRRRGTLSTRRLPARAELRRLGRRDPRPRRAPGAAPARCRALRPGRDASRDGSGAGVLDRRDAQRSSSGRGAMQPSPRIGR